MVESQLKRFAFHPPKNTSMFTRNSSQYWDEICFSYVKLIAPKLES